MSNKVPSIPAVPLGSEGQEILDPIKAILETRSGIVGSVEDRWVTVQDLIDLGLTTKDDFEKMLRGR